MQRVALNRSNPTPRLTSIASAAARRQVAVVPVVVEAEVAEIADSLGTSIETINSSIFDIENRLSDLENP